MPVVTSNKRKCISLYPVSHTASTCPSVLNATLQTPYIPSEKVWRGLPVLTSHKRIVLSLLASIFPSGLNTTQLDTIRMSSESGGGCPYQHPTNGSDCFQNPGSAYSERVSIGAKRYLVIELRSSKGPEIMRRCLPVLTSHKRIVFLLPHLRVFVHRG